MNLKPVYKEYLKRHPTCFLENNNIKLNQRLGALFTEYFMNEYNLFKEEIREIELERIAEMYFQTRCRLSRIHSEALTFEEFVGIHNESKRLSKKKIKWVIV
jgi:thiamine kinase-like enzyme